MGVSTEPKMKMRPRLAIATDDLGISDCDTPWCWKTTRSRLDYSAKHLAVTRPGVVLEVRSNQTQADGPSSVSLGRPPRSLLRVQYLWIVNDSASQAPS